ncbi:unnamed protein product [Trichobilharzia szidati]|nr:unnamed protein product [Trichobilharzia szidati]CAH8834028.1 unnamed protein product [Trichobilharzia szidati]
MGTNRIVMLLDMDCFYVQVEQRENPETIGKPCVVVQYNEWKGGGALAVSYEARALGIKRGMFGDVIRAQYPDTIMFKVPEKRGKAELTKYRVAGSEVIQCISEFTKDIERASIDEAYVDLTDIVDSTLTRDEDVSSLKPNSESFVVANSDIAEQSNLELTGTNCLPLNGVDWIQLLDSNFAEGRRLAVASGLVYNIRQAIFKKTGFKCSAGIGPNKSIAKLACSLNKPNKQTLIPQESIPVLLENTPISKIRNLGGKLGSAVIKQFNIETLGQLSTVPISLLSKEFGEKTAIWLHDLSRGIDHESVVSRSLAQSVGCSKNFMGRAMLTTSGQIKRWLLCLTEELYERLDDDYNQNQRYPTRLIVYARTANHLNYAGGISRTLPSNLLQFIGYNSNNENCNIDKSTLDDNDSNSNSNLGPNAMNSMKYSSHIEKLANAAVSTLKDVFYKGEAPEIWDPGITCLGLTAGKFTTNPCASNLDIRCLLQKKQQQQQEVSDANCVVQQEESVPVHLPSTDKNVSSSSISTNPTTSSSCSSTSSILTACPDNKADLRNIPSENKRTSPNDTDNNNNNDNRNKCMSFFKRLRVAEISAPFHPIISSVDTTTTTTNNATTDSLQSNDTLENDIYRSLDKSPACLDIDSESRHSSTSDSSNFFTSYSVADWIICDKCNSRVSVWQIPEHEDFHIAQRIQQEWKNEEVSSPAKASIATTNNSTSSLSNKIITSSKVKSQSKQIMKKQVKHQKPSSTLQTIDKYFYKAS